MDTFSVYGFFCPRLIGTQRRDNLLSSTTQIERLAKKSWLAANSRYDHHPCRSRLACRYFTKIAGYVSGVQDTYFYRRYQQKHKGLSGGVAKATEKARGACLFSKQHTEIL
jgi:hypothetical protein